MKYSISRSAHDGTWIWCGDGNTDEGTTAQLPEEVYDFADTGQTGKIEVGGETYRIVTIA